MSFAGSASLLIDGSDTTGAGAMGDLQQQVQQAIDELVGTGAERGLQVAVYQDGKQVVEAVAGVADATTARPVTPDTPFYAYSVGKGATAAVVHVLAEDGVLDYDTPIAELWPEFAAHRKQHATIRHALTHSVGVPGLPSNLTPEDLCDWDKMCAIVADAEPWWEPGTKVGYHAYTFGYIVGEVVRRATGKRISEVLLERISGPLGVGDELYIGVPSSELGRLARLEDAEGSAEMLASIPDDAPMFQLGSKAIWPTAEFGNRRDVLMAEIPAGGKLSARGIARMYAALLGEVDGVRLVSPERLRELSAVAVDDVDQIMGFRTREGLGYGIGRPGTDPAETPTVFGMAGVGGGYAWADTATGTAVAVNKNLLTGDFDVAARIGEIVAKHVGG
jgi:CubicO group peptidase (beta-lactamase class C family)